MVVFFFGIILLLVLLIVVASFIAADKVVKVPIKGSRVVVTGGSDGLGLSICKQLVEQGANVVVIARQLAKLDEAMIVLGHVKNGDQIVNKISADVSDPEGIKAAIIKASQMLGGGIDVLINNAGITRPGRFEELEPEWFQRVMNVNYYGNINAIRAVLPIMKEQKKGRVISVASMLGMFGCMGYSAYAPTKAAIVSLYETLHQEYHVHGISFSVAVPGSIGSSSFFDGEQKIKPQETLELERNDPILSPEEVAKPIVNSLNNWNFLVSPSGMNSHLTSTVCAGMGPASFGEVLCQVFGAGILRLVTLFAFNNKALGISKQVHSIKK